MKKLKKALAILSSVMMILACGILPIYAEESADESTVTQQEKITDVKEIKKLISNYIDEQKFLPDS